MKKATKTKNISKNNKRSVISLENLIKVSWLDISSFWRALLAITAVYAIIYFIFVAGVPLFPTTESLTASIEESFGSTAGKLMDSLAIVGLSVSSVSSASNGLLQIFLFLIASASVVWALRKQRGLNKISVKQAYYEGASNIVPMILVVVLLLLTMVPAAFASVGLNLALPVIGTTTEKVVIYSIATPLIVWSLYLLVKWWPALYVIMLPNTTPIASMRTASALTRKRRFKIFIRILFIFFFIALFFLSATILMALISSRLAPITVYVMTFASFLLGHVMLFNLYRSLVDEPKVVTKSQTA